MAMSAPTASSNSLTRARAELDTLAAQASTQDDAIGSLAERTTALRESIERLTDDIRDSVGTAIGEAQGGADRLAEAAAAVRPEIGWLRDADRRNQRAARCDGRRDRAAARAVRRAARERRRRGRGRPVEARRARVDACARSSARRRTSAPRPGPALIASLVQVKEAAAHAAERAREAIEAVDPGEPPASCRRRPRGARAGNPREHRGAAARGRDCRCPGGRIRLARRRTG